MINFNKSFMFVIITLFFGFSIAGNIQAQTNSNLNGKWVTTSEGIEIELILNDGDYEQIIGGYKLEKGTYTTTKKQFNMVTTYVFGETFAVMAKISGLEAKWYTRDELSIALSKILSDLGVSDVEIASVVSELVKTYSYNYTLKKDVFTLKSKEQKIVYNKR